MKILQINKFYYRRRGAETYFLDLIDLLKSHGHAVAVFAMEHPENLPTPYSQYFVENMELGEDSTQAVPMLQKIKIAKNIIWNRQAQKKLEQLLQSFKPDIVHIHNIYHQISPSILSTIKRHNIPIVQTLHDYKLMCPNYQMFTQGKPCERCSGHNYLNAVRYNCLQNSRSASVVAAAELYTHKLLQVYERNVDCFISPSQFLAKKMGDWHIRSQALQVIPNFLAHLPPAPTDQPGEYLLYAGALNQAKGVDLLLDSFEKSHYAMPLFVAGSGPLADRVKRTPNVRFLGQLAAAELAKVTSQALAVVVPSRYYENYPYSVLEAFAQGKPVIGANSGGIPEQVIPGQTGWLFKANHTESLRDTVEEVISHPAQAVTLGQNARSWVSQNADAEEHYRQIYALYQRYNSSNA